jgi:hypothetical protein
VDTPQVINENVDPERRVKNLVHAYRVLTREEIVVAVQQYLIWLGRKKPRRNSEVRIFTILGRSA